MCTYYFTIPITSSSGIILTVPYTNTLTDVLVIYLQYHIITLYLYLAGRTHMFQPFALATMNRPTEEDVMSDEERSIESEDLQKDEISDLFDHSAEDLEDTSLENPSDLTTTQFIRF
jgi:hypothetical protein